MKRLSIAVPVAALALLGGIALAGVATAATNDEPTAPTAPTAEHAVVSGGVSNDVQLPTLGLDD